MRCGCCRRYARSCRRCRGGLYDPVSAVHAIMPMVPAVAAHHDAAVSALAPLIQIASSIGSILISALITVWLVGAVLWFGWQMLRYAGFIERATRSASLLTRVGRIDFLITGA